MKRQIPELLSPAGNMEKLKAAIRFGADAVYLAGGGFGMRAASTDFSDEDLCEAVRYAHERGKKVYVTVNTMPHTDEYPALTRYADVLRKASPDALIVADIGVLFLLKELLPGMEFHLSTQANAVSAAACRAWYSLGVKRIVLARELTLEEIRAIRREIPDDLELEAFVHGSMCISYSGRCLLSGHLTGRDANRGGCTQPCRWYYTLTERQFEITEEGRPNQPMPIVEEKGETFILASRDTAMVEHLSDLADAGIASLKIEGRMKSVCYTAVVTNTYRMALDALKSGDAAVDPRWMSELCSVSHREFATGYYYQDPHDYANTVKTPGYIGEKSYLARVLSVDPASGLATLEQRNKFSLGDRVELLTPGQFGQAFTCGELYNEEGEAIDSVPHPMMIFKMKIPFPVGEGDILRMPTDETTGD